MSEELRKKQIKLTYSIFKNLKNDEYKFCFDAEIKERGFTSSDFEEHFAHHRQLLSVIKSKQYRRLQIIPDLSIYDKNIRYLIDLHKVVVKNVEFSQRLRDGDFDWC
ncbi:hypothetical protein V6560_000671 [Vibrio parahaemolyticus]